MSFSNSQNRCYRTSVAALTLRIAACVGFFIAVGISAYGADTWTNIIPGVDYLYRTTSSPRPLKIHVLVVDASNPRVRVGTIFKKDNTAADSGERVSSMAMRHGALAAINADYFSSGTVEDHIPQGMHVSDGFKVPISGHVTNRPSWVFNQSTKESLIDVYATTYPYSPPSWVFNAASGGPRLVRNGAISIENTSGVPSAYSLNPRTAIGISQNKKTLYFAVVDGRQTGISEGMTGVELGQMLIDLGAYDVLNFDGGGSSTFYLNGLVKNVPSDGSERFVANAVAIWDLYSQNSSPLVFAGTGFESPYFLNGSINSQGGWTTGGGATVQTAVKRSGTQALQIDQGSAELSFTPQTDKVRWLDFYLKRETAVGTSAVWFGASSGSLFGAVGFQGSSLSYYQGNTFGGGIWKTIVGAGASGFYRVSVRIDYNSGINKYGVYIDGRQYAAGIPYKDSGATSGLGYLRIEDSGSGSLIVDDLYAGNTYYTYPRVEPDSASLPVNSYRPFSLRNSSATLWEVIDERLPNNAAAPAGSIGVITTGGILKAVGEGSLIVRATDSVSRKDTTSRITVTAGQTLPQIKSANDGTYAEIGSSVVSSIYSDHLYIQKQDRASGLRVISSYTGAVGDLVSVAGSTGTLLGEEVLNASFIVKGQAAAPPLPLYMSNRTLTREIVPGNPAGLDSTGLLVATFGRVVSVESGYFLINDGAVASGGLAVINQPGVSVTVGDMVLVKGAHGRALVNGNPEQCIKLRTISDVTVLD